MKLDKENPGLKEGLFVFFWYFGKFSWECIKTAFLALAGMFLLASICSFATTHPILMFLTVLAGYFLYQNVDAENKED